MHRERASNSLDVEERNTASHPDEHRNEAAQTEGSASEEANKSVECTNAVSHEQHNGASGPNNIQSTGSPEVNDTSDPEYTAPELNNAAPSNVYQSKPLTSLHESPAVIHRRRLGSSHSDQTSSNKASESDTEPTKSTSPTDTGFQTDVSSLEVRAYMHPSIKKYKQSGRIDNLSGFVPVPVETAKKLSLSAPPFARFRSKSDAPLPYHHPTEDKTSASKTPGNSARVAETRLKDKNILLEAKVRKQQQIIERLRYDQALQAAEVIKNHHAQLRDINNQVQVARVEKEDALKHLGELESQLAIAQEKLAAEDEERKRMDLVAHELSGDWDVNSVSNASPMDSFHQRMAERRLGRRPQQAASSNLQQSDAATRLESHLKHTARELTKERLLSAELKKERDQALSLKDTALGHLAKLRADYEIEQNKVHILEGNMQDEPAKTAEVDKHLEMKDANYKQLEQQYGECLADNAELQSKLGNSQEDAEWRIKSLEKKMAAQEDTVINKSRTLESFFQSHDKIIAMHKSRANDQEWVNALEERWTAVVDHNRLQCSQMAKLKDRESELVQEVLSLRSESAAAKAEAGKKSDEIAELECQKSHADRGLERLRLDAAHHEDDLAAKDRELQTALQDAQTQIQRMTTLIYAKGDEATQMLLQELKTDHEQLQNCYAQLSESHKLLEHQMWVIEQTRARDEEALVLANEAHDCNTSRMVAAEEQVTDLIKQLSGRDPPTNERLWQQWRNSETARIEVRQAFERLNSFNDDVKALAMDLASYVNKIGTRYEIEVVPGTEMFNEFQGLGERIKQLLNPSGDELA